MSRYSQPIQPMKKRKAKSAALPELPVSPFGRPRLLTAHPGLRSAIRGVARSQRSKRRG